MKKKKNKKKKNENKKIVTSRSRYYKLKNGELTMDAMAFGKSLEFATGITAVVVGKPASKFFKTGVEKLSGGGEKLKNEEVVMIGDDILSDIGGAQEAGLRGILVKTGKFCEEDLEEQGEKVKPFMIVDDFAHAIDWILSQ